jgi:NDP-sugar pyrophosphorylase family protein
LQPYTTIVPKPLLPVGDYPILEILIRQLKRSSFTRIAISVGHLAGLIEAYFGTGEKWGVDISYVQEDSPLGTAGAIKLVKEVEENFLVMNGDILTDIDMRDLFQSHVAQKCIGTVGIKPRKIKSDFGEIEIKGQNELVSYTEKPERQSFASIGINVFHERARSFIKVNENIGIPDLVARFKAAGEKVSCYQMHGIWLDLGRFNDLQEAQDVFLANKEKFL